MTQQHHLRLRSEFNHLRSAGKKIVMPSMLFIVAPSLDGNMRCGVICSKKYSLLAVKRNRARRLLYESFRLIYPNLQGSVWILLIPRFKMDGQKCQNIQKEMQKAAEKAGLLVK